MCVSMYTYVCMYVCIYTYMTLYYITLHDITLHYITLHYYIFMSSELSRYYGPSCHFPTHQLRLTVSLSYAPGNASGWKMSSASSPQRRRFLGRKTCDGSCSNQDGSRTGPSQAVVRLNHGAPNLEDHPFFTGCHWLVGLPGRNGI